MRDYESMLTVMEEGEDGNNNMSVVGGDYCNWQWRPRWVWAAGWEEADPGGIAKRL
jgi:hypothetical protein